MAVRVSVTVVVVGLLLLAVHTRVVTLLLLLLDTREQGLRGCTLRWLATPVVRVTTVVLCIAMADIERAHKVNQHWVRQCNFSSLKESAAARYNAA